jgi:drug/metabolite transporter (DMT)-like permease
MKPFYLIILLLLNFFWAAVYSAYKVIGGPGQLDTGGIVSLRFGLAGICLLAFWPLFPGPAPKGRHLLMSGLLGFILFVVGQRLQVYGNELGTAGNSSVLMAIEPLVTSVAAALVLKEKLGPRRVAGFALGLIGVAVLNRVWAPDFRWSGLGASVLVILSFVCEAAYSVIGKPIVARASVMKMVAISLVVGTVLNLLIDGPTTFAAARKLDARAWALLSVMAVICTSVGYSVWFLVIRECPVNVAALTVFSQAVFGTLIAAVWVGEKLHWGQLAGSLIIVCGLVLGLSRQVHGRNPAQPQGGETQGG